MTPPGSCCIVLHGHLPYVHHPDHEDFLEEDWYFEAVVETYLPLLHVLDDLSAEDVPVRMAVGLTPTLLEMFRAPSLAAKFEAYMERRGRLAASEVRRLEGRPLLHRTALHYAARHGQLLELHRALGGDLAAGFRRHMEEGRLEILASAATHPILPLLATDEGRSAQIRAGAALYHEVFGRPPSGFWLPECAFSPGLERLLVEAGIDYVILESHGILGARPPSPFGVRRPVRTPAGLRVFGRDQESSRQVWSAEVGYPGDPVYRELYRDLGFDGHYDYVREFLHADGLRRNLGFKYHRITGDVPLHEKEPYDPQAARERAGEHALHFLRSRAEQAERGARSLHQPIIMLSPYDMELFGHWWYEGPHFLADLFRHMADRERRPRIKLVAPEDVLRAGGPCPEAVPALGTWGRRGYFDVWLSEKNAWLLPHQHEAEMRMIEAARRRPEREEATAPILDQMLRELFLLQSSDWAFIIDHETASHYAEKRAADHLDRFLRLEAALRRPDDLDREWFETVRREDALLPGLDYRLIIGGPVSHAERLGTRPRGTPAPEV